MKMQTQLKILVSVIIAIVCLLGYISLKKDGLILSGGIPIAYQCKNGEQIFTRYYSLSDNSLNFVKVTMPDGQEHTLPHVFSGSGERYTDEFRLVWWIKGHTAFIEVRDQNGEWQIKYRKCSEILV
jgi:membrane-bound inhibitor of C-type lysozyme